MTASDEQVSQAVLHATAWEGTATWLADIRAGRRNARDLHCDPDILDAMTLAAGIIGGHYRAIANTRQIEE